MPNIRTLTLSVATVTKTWDDRVVEMYSISDETGFVVCRTESRSLALDFMADPDDYQCFDVDPEIDMYDTGPWEPDVNEYDRQRTLEERDHDYLAEKREIAYTSDPSTWGGDEFPF